MRMFTLAATVLTAGMVFQLGACLTNGAIIGMAGFDFCSLLGPNCTLGPFGFCGSNLTAADDLLVDCPPPLTP